MNNKKLYIALGIMFISLTINGCSETPDSSVVSAFSGSIIEIEIPEPIEEPEPTDNEQVDTTGANGSQGSIEDINESEIVEGTALTQEEIDALKATATTDMAKRGIEIYESMESTGSWTNPESGDRKSVV